MLPASMSELHTPHTRPLTRWNVCLRHAWGWRMLLERMKLAMKTWVAADTKWLDSSTFAAKGAAAAFFVFFLL